MSDSPHDRMKALIREAEKLPYGEVRLSLCEEAVKFADETRSPELMFYARLPLILAAGFRDSPRR